MSEPGEDDAEQEQEPPTCCLLRRKIVVGILRVFSEEECGVSDSELVDVLRFDLATPSGKPVLAFRFCPWCGEPREPGGETRIVELHEPEGDDASPEEDDD